MNFIQTLFTFKKNLTKESFGWRSAEDHLNAWCLSSLLLQRQKKKIVLYSDNHGYDILINHLKLPYNQFENITNDVLINDNFWAAPKIITYSKQQSPFVHVDGDVFLWKKIPNKIVRADLVAQNFETCKSHYKKEISTYFEHLNYLPKFLYNEIIKETFKSCNAGFLGGSNISFIHNYCSEALKIIYSNKHIKNQNINVLFEQILFASMAKREKLQISTLIDGEIAEGRYLKDRFCNFFLSKEKQFFMHVVGEMKRDEFLCEMIAKTLHFYFPEHFNKVKQLFSINNRHFINGSNNNIFTTRKDVVSTKINYNKITPPNKMSSGMPGFAITKVFTSDEGTLLGSINSAKYINQINSFSKWISKQYEKFNSHQTSCKFDNQLVPFVTGAAMITAIEKKRYNFLLRCSKNIAIYHQSSNWNNETLSLIIKNYCPDDNQSISGILYTVRFQDNAPLLSLIDELDENILYLLRKKKSFKDLHNLCCNMFSATSRQSKQDVKKLITIRIKSLYEKNACEIYRLNY